MSELHNLCGGCEERFLYDNQWQQNLQHNWSDLKEVAIFLSGLYYENCMLCLNNNTLLIFGEIVRS